MYVLLEVRTLLEYYNDISKYYRTLRGQDQREKCTLNFIKYTFCQQTVLYCPQRVLYCNAKSALLYNKALFAVQ